MSDTKGGSEWLGQRRKSNAAGRAMPAMGNIHQGGWRRGGDDVSRQSKDDRKHSMKYEQFPR